MSIRRVDTFPSPYSWPASISSSPRCTHTAAAAVGTCDTRQSAGQPQSHRAVLNAQPGTHRTDPLIKQMLGVAWHADGAVLDLVPLFEVDVAHVGHLATAAVFLRGGPCRPKRCWLKMQGRGNKQPEIGSR